MRRPEVFLNFVGNSSTFGHMCHVLPRNTQGMKAWPLETAWTMMESNLKQHTHYYILRWWAWSYVFLIFPASEVSFVLGRKEVQEEGKQRRRQIKKKRQLNCFNNRVRNAWDKYHSEEYKTGKEPVFNIYGYLSRSRNICLPRDMYKNIHSSPIQNSLKLETIQGSTNNRIEISWGVFTE